LEAGSWNAVKTGVVMGSQDFDSLFADYPWELECCENRSDNGRRDFDSLSADSFWELECCENRCDNGGAKILIHYLQIFFGELEC